MTSIGEVRRAIEQMEDREFPLLLAGGSARVVAADATGPDLLVRGLRVRLTWDRLQAMLERLSANHTLGVDELGGGDDALGIVSLLAHTLADDVRLSKGGVLVLKHRDGSPIHQHADMTAPMPRRLWRRRSAR